MENINKQIIKSYCHSCCNENNHEILFIQSIHSDDGDYNWSTDYRTIRCLGCGCITFRKDFHDYEQAFPNEDDEWEYPITTTIYPPYLKDHRGLDGLWNLPKSIQVIYLESIQALKSDCKLLAGAGFRSVIEAICLHKHIKGRNLEQQINNLAKEGIITKKECERLHSIRFLGNDSIHEMKVPDGKQLKLVLDIVEHILKNIYLIDYEVDKILEKPINDFPTFRKLLEIKLQVFNSSDEFPLVKFLGKDARRVKENFVDFERTLVDEISNGTFSKLSIGAVQPYSGSTGSVQHYIVI